MNTRKYIEDLLQNSDGPQGGIYYQAAKQLGNPAWRAQIWRILNEDEFKPSAEFLRALWRWAEVEPVVVEASPGSPIFGDVGWLETGKVVAVLILPPEEWRRHSIKCQVCSKLTPRWSPSQKYCRRHDWASGWQRSPAGQRWRKRDQAPAKS